MVGGMKTTAGTNRIIPICNKIIPLVEARMDKSCKYLISNKFGNHYTYKVFYDSFVTTMKKLNMHHIPHDCRYTFASLADNVGMNEVCLKKIMGHSIQDITKGVYTDKLPHELLEEVQKLNSFF
jgi:integrase